jgi:hypothetical protein
MQPRIQSFISKENAGKASVGVAALPENQLPDIENLCGHDTGGFREQSRSRGPQHCAQ